MFASRWICKHIMRISCTCIYPYVPSRPLISTTYSSMFISHTLQPDWTVYHSPNTSHTYLDLWLSAACCLHLDFFSSASQHTHILSSGIRAILLCNCTSSMKAFLMPPDDGISAFCGPPWHFEACVRHCLCSTLHYKGSLVIFEKHKSHHATLWPKTLQTHHHIALAVKSGFLQEGLQV